MKVLLNMTILLAGLATIQAGSEYLVKQRAKDLRDQNNERQDVLSEKPANAAPVRPVTQTVVVPYAAQPSTPLLSTSAQRISEAIETLGSQTPASDAAQQQLTDSLEAANQAASKSSSGKLNRLSHDLSIALAGKQLSGSERSKLSTQLERVINQTLSAQEMETLAGQVVEMLRSNGVGKVDATVVSNDIKSIVAERQKAAKN